MCAPRSNLQWDIERSAIVELECPADVELGAFRTEGFRAYERDGWSFDRLRDHPHGVTPDLPDPTEGWERKIGFPDRKLRLWHDELARDLGLARSRAEVPRGWLKLISRRDIRSMNSWMHNIDVLSRSQTPVLLIHPLDAQERNISDGDDVRVATRFGEVVVRAQLSADMIVGAVCYPHGWGHAGGWKVANAKAGQNINLLLGIGPDTVEGLAGMTLMDGLPVQVQRSLPPPHLATSDAEQVA